jgi:hypothetical protein
MAVESKHGGNGASATLTGVPTASGTITGMPAQAPKRKKRASSLLAVASSLPSVETSLEEFIARANQTDVDANTWDSAEREARQEDEKRKEADALRWKAAEEQLRDGQTRESHLKHKLDGLQGKLAEAEARVAVALSSSSISTQQVDAAAKSAELAEVRARLAAAEDRAATLSSALVAAKQDVVLRRPTSFDDERDDERVALAEAKAAKAIAAARAAAAGLTVSPADLAAIESGLVVTDFEPPRRTPWLALAASFVGGLAIMFGVFKLTARTVPVPAAPAAVAQPAPEPTQPPTPTAAPVAPAPTQAAVAPQTPSHPTVTPIEEPNAPKVEPIEPPPAAPPAEVAVHHAAPAVHHAAVRRAPTPPPAPAKQAKPADGKTGLVDPF